MQLACDLHLHSTFSFDSKTPVADLVTEAVRMQLDVIAVTDHDTVEGGLAAERFAKQQKLPILVIPGQEVRTREGELLVLGLRETLRSGSGLVETATEAKEAGGFLIAPHPFDWLRGSMGNRIRDVAKLLDAVEGWNAKCLFAGMDQKAERMTRELGLPAVSSSDAHLRTEVGHCRTRIEAKARAEKAIFEAIRAGRSELVQNRISWESRVKSSFQKLR